MFLPTPRQSLPPPERSTLLGGLAPINHRPVLVGEGNGPLNVSHLLRVRDLG
jgi:hypothetical protein